MQNSHYHIALAPRGLFSAWYPGLLCFNWPKSNVDYDYLLGIVYDTTRKAKPAFIISVLIISQRKWRYPFCFWKKSMSRKELIYVKSARNVSPEWNVFIVLFHVQLQLCLKYKPKPGPLSKRHQLCVFSCCNMFVQFILSRFNISNRAKPH